MNRKTASSGWRNARRLIGLLRLLVAGRGRCASAVPGLPPNIVLILADDLGSGDLVGVSAQASARGDEALSPGASGAGWATPGSNAIRGAW